MKYFLAIDFGATSGRHILGHYENGELKLQEIYRFPNKLIENNGHLYWNLNKLIQDMLEGIKKCNDLNIVPESISIDTFGVDYVLLDEADKLIRDVYCYRDNRTQSAKEEFHHLMPVERLYQITGVYPQVFNTLYQLFDDKKQGLLSQTKTIMFLPCYLTYLLTGTKYNELSIASTSGLLNIDNYNYDEEILNLLGLNKNIFSPFMPVGSTIGKLKKEIADYVGFNCDVKVSFHHDTGAAVKGAEVKYNELFLSSGTWSLIGVFLNKSNTSKEALNKGFTNELNDKNEVRFLKNIIGMYLVTRVKDENTPALSYGEIVDLAEKGTNYKEIFDATDDRFLAPKNMTEEINNYFKENNIKEPQNINELYYCIYHSLARSYKKAIEEIENLTNQKYVVLKIFGGGSQNKFLNKLTEQETKLKIVVGPSEATAIGNLLVQAGK